MSSTQKPGLLGQLIGGRFRVEKLLGSGGMGEVYLGRHELLGNRVAIKLLCSRRHFRLSEFAHTLLQRPLVRRQIEIQS